MFADEEDVQLVPSVVLLSFTGALALMLAMQAAVLGSPLAAPGILFSAALLAAGGLLRPNRSWSLRIAMWVAPAAAIVWLATFLVADAPGDPTVAAVSLGMVGASFWIRHQLRAMLIGPARPSPTPALTAGPTLRPTSGWIEELPGSA